MFEKLRYFSILAGTNTARVKLEAEKSKTQQSPLESTTFSNIRGKLQ